MCNNWLFHNGRVGSGGRKRLVVILVLRFTQIYVFVDSVGGLLSGSVAGDRLPIVWLHRKEFKQF